MKVTKEPPTKNSADDFPIILFDGRNPKANHRLDGAKALVIMGYTTNLNWWPSTVSPYHKYIEFLFFHTPNKMLLEHAASATA